MSRAEPVDEREYRWTLRRAHRVVFDERYATFLVATRPEGKGETLEQLLERWERDPQRALPEHLERWGPLEYEPLKCPQLPNALARIAEAFDDKHESGARREATRFLNTYGPLGFQTTRATDQGDEIPATSLGIPGEPLYWMIAEARTVRFALELIDALHNRSQAGVLAALRSQCRGATELTHLPPDMAIHYLLARGVSWRDGSIAVGRELQAEPQGPVASWYSLRATYAAPKSIVDALLASAEMPSIEPLGEADLEALNAHGGRIIADLVQAHGASPSVNFGWREGRFREWPQRGNLLCAIWTLLRRMALRGERIRYCDECGTPFVATDARQRFCPPDPWSTSRKSRCLTRQQMHKRRSQPTDGTGATSGTGDAKNAGQEST